MSLELQNIPAGQKRLLAGVVAAAAIALVYFYGVSPMNRKATEANQKIHDLNAQNDKSYLQIRNVQRLRAENLGLSNEVFSVTNRYVARPVLGSYPMERRIYELVANGGFRVGSCRELGAVETPRLSPTEIEKAKGKKTPKGKAPPKPRHYFERYQMEVRGQGGYADVVRLVQALEDENPFFSVVSLRIVANARTPELHDVTFTFEWPVEAANP